MQKTIHGVLQFCAIGFIVFGLVAVICFKVELGHNNFYSMHSWFGLLTILAFVAQVNVTTKGTRFTNKCMDILSSINNFPAPLRALKTLPLFSISTGRQEQSIFANDVAFLIYVQVLTQLPKTYTALL